MKKEVYLLNCPPGWIKTPPLGLEYLKQYLKSKRIEVIILDVNILIYKKISTDKAQWLSLNKSFENNLFNFIEQKHPDLITSIIKSLKNASLIGFSLFKRNKDFSLSLAKRIREIYPVKNIVFGGPHTLFMKIYQENFDDAFRWVIGEGETALRKISQNSTRNNFEFEELINLDSLPFIDFQELNPSCYSTFLPLLSSRGCVRKCNFCTEKLLYKKFRQHSSSYMIDQINVLTKGHQQFNFTFQDSLINADINWLYTFCLLLIKHNMKINWDAQGIIRNDFSVELAKLLKRSGCFNFFIGLETASDKMLKAMNKGFSQDDAITFFKNLHTANLHFEISLIFGYPGEEEEDFQATVDFIIKNKNIIPKIAQVNPFVDYFSNKNIPNKKGIERTERFLDIVRIEKIPYTKGFINNLIDKPR